MEVPSSCIPLDTLGRLEQTAGDVFYFVQSKPTFTHAIRFLPKFDRKGTARCLMDERGLTMSGVADACSAGIVGFFNSRYFSRYQLKRIDARTRQRIPVDFSISAKRMADSLNNMVTSDIKASAFYDDFKHNRIIHEGHCSITRPSTEPDGAPNVLLPDPQLGVSQLRDQLELTEKPTIVKFDARALEYGVQIDLKAKWFETACLSVAEHSQYVQITWLQTEHGPTLRVSDERNTTQKSWVLSNTQLVKVGQDWPCAGFTPNTTVNPESKSDESKSTGMNIEPISMWITDLNAKRMKGMSKIHLVARLFLHPTNPLIISFILEHHGEDPTHPSNVNLWFSNVSHVHRDRLSVMDPHLGTVIEKGSTKTRSSYLFPLKATTTTSERPANNTSILSSTTSSTTNASSDSDTMTDDRDVKLEDKSDDSDSML